MVITNDNPLHNHKHARNHNLKNAVVFFTMTNKCIIFHKLSHSYMFRHYHVILRELVNNTLPSYTSISKAAVEIHLLV